jgi:hypothetical protein
LKSKLKTYGWKCCKLKKSNRKENKLHQGVEVECFEIEEKQTMSRCKSRVCQSRRKKANCINKTAKREEDC